MALAFIAFFAVVVIAVLNFADATGLQHVHTEKTASNDSLAEGGAAWAAADAKSDALACIPGDIGHVTMVGGDVASYQIEGCNPGNTGQGLSGTPCVLCILNQTPIPPATSTSAATTVLAYQAASGIPLAVNGGDVDVNGSIADGTIVAATPSASYVHINVLSGATYPASGLTPTPTTYAVPITDPLVNIPAPPPAGMPSGCTAANGASWDPVQGCSISPTSTQTVNPGLWHTIQASGTAGTVLTLNPGNYVFTGAFTTSGQVGVTANGVLIYLGCTNYGAGIGQPCPSSGQQGGYVDLSGQGALNVFPQATGQYAGITVLADPLRVDPNTSGAAHCITNPHAGDCLLNTSGQGQSINGNVDTRSGGTFIGGNGASGISGRLITNSLIVNVSSHLGPGLSLGAGISGPLTACRVYDDDVAGSPQAGGAYPIGVTTRSVRGSSTSLTDPARALPGLCSPRHRCPAQPRTARLWDL
ncbi:MAG: hypothetical protein E6J45_10415 [Chloroflexi bacterium]|nr:MAG: hypothetical protein E6J45_10415 [Chloroflexota bacterium]